MLSLLDTAKKLGINKRTILREVHRGNLKASKVGNKFVIDETSLDAYLNQKTAKFQPSKAINVALTEFINAKRSEMFFQLQRMVSTSSVTEEDNEEVFAQYIGEILKQNKLRHKIVGKHDSASVHASYGTTEKGLLFDCPLDTVSIGNPERWTYPPFDGIVHNGKMYGRGTADCKAGIVAMIYALIALKHFIPEEKLRIELVFDGGEQTGEYLGMREILKTALKVDAGIIGYGGDQTEVGIGARGYHRYKLTVHGQAVHTGSRTRNGVNAIQHMAQILNEFQKNPFGSAKNPKYFDFGSKMTVAQINGGTAINLVPDKCEILLDFRTTPDQTVIDTKQYLETAITRVENENNEKYSYNIEYITGREGYVVSEADQLLTSFETSYKNYYGKEITRVVHGASHIGALFNETQIPVLVWGPQGENSHAYDEFVVLDSIPQTAITYALTALKFFGIDENTMVDKGSQIAYEHS